MNTKQKQNAIVKAYIENPRYHDQVKYILNGYLDDETAEDINERYEDIKKNAK